MTKKEYEKSRTGSGTFYWMILIVAVWMVYSFVNIQKKYPVYLTVDKWNWYDGGMEAVKQALNKSDLPSRDVNFLCDSVLTKFQIEMRTQIVPQLEAEKPKKDSIPNKN